MKTDKAREQVKVKGAFSPQKAQNSQKLTGWVFISMRKIGGSYSVGPQAEFMAGFVE